MRIESLLTVIRSMSGRVAPRPDQRPMLPGLFLTLGASGSGRSDPAFAAQPGLSQVTKWRWLRAPPDRSEARYFRGSLRQSLSSRTVTLPANDEVSPNDRRVYRSASGYRQRRRYRHGFNMAKRFTSFGDMTFMRDRDLALDRASCEKAICPMARSLAVPKLSRSRGAVW